MLETLSNIGAGVAPDTESAQLYQKACDDGDAEGCYRLGTLYMYGGEGVRGYAKALEFYQKACDAGSLESCSLGKGSAGPIEAIEKPPGGQTVADCYAQADSLNDSEVIVRGQVVKFNANILGTNWLHLQDGSGDAASNTADLTVTSANVVVAVGDVVTLKGILHKDKVLGPSMTYAVILEDAELVEWPADHGRARVEPTKKKKGGGNPRPTNLSGAPIFAPQLIEVCRKSVVVSEAINPKFFYRLLTAKQRNRRGWPQSDVGFLRALREFSQLSKVTGFSQRPTTSISMSGGQRPAKELT